MLPEKTCVRHMLYRSCICQFKQVVQLSNVSEGDLFHLEVIRELYVNQIRHNYVVQTELMREINSSLGINQNL